MPRNDLYSVTSKLCHLAVGFYSYLAQNIFLWLWHWFELCFGDIYCSVLFISTCFFLADMASQDCERFRIPPSFIAEGSYCAGKVHAWILHIAKRSTQVILLQTTYICFVWLIFLPLITKLPWQVWSWYAHS